MAEQIHPHQGATPHYVAARWLIERTPPQEEDITRRRPAVQEDSHSPRVDRNNELLARRNDVQNAIDELAEVEDRWDVAGTAAPKFRVSKAVSRKTRSHRRRHRRRSNSETGLDLEQGNRPIMSFVHEEGNEPFLNLYERYRAVNVKYFK